MIAAPTPNVRFSMFDRAGTNVLAWLSDALDPAEFVKGSTVSLAVTGLSRAGKTVFITSLVHNLLSALHQPHLCVPKTSSVLIGEGIT